MLNLQKEDYNIVIFTNQSGLSKEEKRFYLVNSILFELGHQLKFHISLPILIINIGNQWLIFRLIKREYENSFKIFYCGDVWTTS